VGCRTPPAAAVRPSGRDEGRARSGRGAIDAGVEVLTLFAFSEENWNRPALEISALNGAARGVHREGSRRAADQGVQVHVLGDRSRLTPGGCAAVERVERETGGGDKLC